MSRFSSTDSDVLYYSADIINNNITDPIGNQGDPQVSLYSQRQFPIIQDSSDYMMSVIRLSSNGATRNLPLWIPRIQTSSIAANFTANISGSSMTLSAAPPYGSIPNNSKLFGVGTAQIPTPNGIVPVVIELEVAENGQQLEIVGIPMAPIKYPATYTLASPPQAIVYNGVSYLNYNVTNCNMFIGVTQTDPNLTVYSVTLQAVGGTTTGGSLNQQYLIWQPENLYLNAPNQVGVDNFGDPVYTPVAVQNLDTEYYYGYTYDNFTDMLNKAIRAAVLELTPPLGFPNSGGQNPSIVWNTSSNGEAIFYYIPDTLNSDGTSYFNLFLNSNLVSLLPNFPGHFVNLPDGRTFQIIPPTDYSGGQAGFFTPGYAQNYCGTSGWTPCDAIVLTSSTLPIQVEQVTAPGVVGGSDTSYGRGVSPAAFQPIILDMAIRDIDGAEAWRKDFVWEPSGEYRMISMTNASSPIQLVDIQVWWRNRYDNNLYPLRLTNGSSMSVKIMFRRKQMGV